MTSNEKRRQTMIRKLGSAKAYRDYFREIGSEGGKVRVPKGFAKKKGSHDRHQTIQSN